MEQNEIDKAFEGRWRIKQHVFSADDRIQGEIKSLCRDFFEAGILIAGKEATVPPASPLADVPAASPSGLQLQETDSFGYWWELYDLKVGKEKCMTKWAKLTEKERAECIAATPDYVASTPDKQFRKRPLTYLNGKSWNDEIIYRNEQFNKPTIEQQRISKLASILVK